MGDGGAGWLFSWSDQDDGASISAIHAALDAGMNWIDTAAVTASAIGRSRGQGARRPREQAVRLHKWRARLGRESPDRQIAQGRFGRRECEASLRPIKSRCDRSYQIHWPEPDEDVEEGWATLARLKEEGKVRWIGVSNFNLDQLKRAWAIAPITSLQPPYSLIRREVEADVLPYCAEHNIGVIAYSPMGSGMLTGTMTRERIANLPEDDWRRRSPQFQEPLVSAIEDRR